MGKRYNRTAYISSKKIYKDYYVSPNITKIKPFLVNRKYFSDIESDELYSSNFDKELARVEYKEIGLTFYGSKEEMRKSLEDITHNKSFWNKHSLDEYWEQYKKRDILISMGQYEDIRKIQFQEEYLNALGDRLGKNSEQYKLIASLTPDEFIRIATYPNSKTDDPSLYLLPSLKSFYGDKNSVDKVDELKRDINKALGVNEDYGIDKDVNIGKRAKPKRIVVNKKEIIEKEYRRLLNSATRGRIKTAKDGHKYVLFLKRDISKKVIKRLYGK